MKCPGQDSRQWTPDAIFEVACPRCGRREEFFKDEPTRTCKQCNHTIVNPKMDFGCAAYCKYAAQCLGELPPELLAQKKALLKDRVAVAMKRYLGTDFKRIGHAAKVASYAEQIARQEQGDLAVVLVAAYLHDIGIKEAERTFQSAEARYQEQAGPGVAREILSELGADPGLVDEVCDIVGHHHHPRPEETANFKAVYDADQLVNLGERRERAPQDTRKVKEHIDKVFLTATGKRLANEQLLQGLKA